MRNAVISVVMIGAIVGIPLLFLGTPAGPHRKASGSPDRWREAEARPEGAGALAERHFYRGDYEQAAAAYLLRVGEAPTDGLAWARLAFAAHELGHFEEALGYHERAATFEENRIDSLFRRGCALARLGRADDAMAAIQEAIEAGFRDRPWAEQEADLDGLRGDGRLARLLDRMAPPPSGRGPLDPWEGNWVIRDPESGRILGHSSVRRVERGHAFSEHWNEYRGGSGQGMTYLDPADGSWKMVRVDAEGDVYQLEGVFREGALHLTGERRRFGGRVVPLRGVIELKDRDRLRHLVEESEDDGATWAALSDRLLSRDEPFYGGRGGGR